MIYAKLVFPSSTIRQVMEALFALPEEMRPTHRSMDEDEMGTPIRDIVAFTKAVESRGGSFYIKNTRVAYDLRFFPGRPINCKAFLENQPDYAKVFLLQMAAALPIFGFACSWEEQERRNLVTTELGAGTIESWVGRDPQKSIPGLYWLTLLPAALAEKHGVPLPVVERLALEHVVLENDQHLFRFHEQPEDWRSNIAVAELISSLPGVFDVDKIKPLLATAKNFLDYQEKIREWH